MGKRKGGGEPVGPEREGCPPPILALTAGAGSGPELLP